MRTIWYASAKDHQCLFCRYKVNIFIITHKITAQLKCLIYKENKIHLLLPIIFFISIWILRVCKKKKPAYSWWPRQKMFKRQITARTSNVNIFFPILITQFLFAFVICVCWFISPKNHTANTKTIDVPTSVFWKTIVIDINLCIAQKA